MFSTSLPPAVCVSAIEVFRTMQQTDIVEKLRSNSVYLQHKFRSEGFNIMDTATAIIPLIVGEQSILTKMSVDSLNKGVIINPIFPPAVPANLTRFRISVMASHTKEDMDYLVDVMIGLFDKYKLKRYVSK